MSTRLSFDYSDVPGFLAPGALDAAFGRAVVAHTQLHERSGAGAEFLGWLDLPGQDPATLGAIKDCAARVRMTADVLIVIGIGGSYLGARAVIDACTPFLHRSRPEILFAGHHVSGEYLAALMQYCEGREVVLNVISKSGTTTEPALAFRVLRHWMEQRYGRTKAAQRIIATTDAARGSLRTLATAEGYETFVIPDDVGGRFSVFTPVGLLPIACAGIDIDALLEGARAMRRRTIHADDRNPALMYAALRDALRRQGFTTEVLASFQPELASVTEWWKQLFGESEGKQGRGIFPASVINTTDLHSMGQYLQDGMRTLFETFLVRTGVVADELIVPALDDNLDGLGYLEGRTFSSVNAAAHQGTALAHARGGVPCMTIGVPDLGAHATGELLYMFEEAVAVSGYAQGVNPFDQPGVEEYKRSMFALLGKPGFERETAETRAHLDARRVLRID